MKTIALFFSVILLSETASAQDTIPNHGFENWGNNPSYEKPDGWTTLNALTYLLGKITAYKTTAPAEVHSGSHAIKLVSKFITTSDFGPAVVTSGQIRPSGPNAGPYGGNPINSRPSAVTGWYKYFPLGNDQSLFEVNLYKAGVLIGSGSLNQTDSVKEWTSFSVPISYTSSETPDTILISLFASQGGDSPPGEENSTLFIDDVAYSYATGIENIGNEEAFQILPNPASEKITVESRDMSVDHLSIYSVDGKKMKDATVVGGRAEIKVDDLKTGRYLITVYPANAKPVSRFFEVQR